MNRFRRGKWIYLTLFFFIWMLLFPAAYADQGAPPDCSTPTNLNAAADQDISGYSNFRQLAISISPETSVYYVTPEEARRLAITFQKQGYKITCGTSEQLTKLRQNDELSRRVNNVRLAQLGDVKYGEQDDKVNAKKRQDQQEQERKKKRKDESKSSQPPSGGGNVGTVNVNVGHSAKGGFGGGGGSGDAAAVLFVLVGIFVVAVFVVYTVKYLVDVASGKHYDYWWDLGAQKSYLVTHKGEYGRFTSVKLASGYIANKRAYMGLVGELGYMDINLDVNKNDGPVRLDLAGNYWMLGAAARFVMFDDGRSGVSNPSFFFMEFMGGLTEHAATKTIGSARLGFNFGEFNHLRLGLNAGAQYIGLNKEQGFVNNRNNYWFTYGFELGYRF